MRVTPPFARGRQRIAVKQPVRCLVKNPVGIGSVRAAGSSLGHTVGAKFRRFPEGPAPLTTSTNLPTACRVVEREAWPRVTESRSFYRPDA